jgi:hypothetical protein
MLGSPSAEGRAWAVGPVAVSAWEAAGESQLARVAGESQLARPAGSPSAAVLELAAVPRLEPLLALEWV